MRFTAAVLLAALAALPLLPRIADAAARPEDLRRQEKDAPPALAAKGEPSVVGVYRLRGEQKVKGEAVPYDGVCAVYEVEGGPPNTYYVCYTVGGLQYTGVGLREGSRLSVGWTLERPGQRPQRGVTVYTVRGDGNVLEGPYTSFPGSSGTEKLTRIPD